MKRLYYIVVLMLMGSSLWAEGFNVRFTPKRLMVNNFSTFDVDPLHPESQPFLTNFTVSKTGTAERFEMQVQIKWNNAVIVGENEAIYRSIPEVSESTPMTLTNRDLVSNQSGVYLHSEANIDLMQAVKAYPTLEEALLAGYFPDGDLQLYVSVRTLGGSLWEASDVFTLVVRNAGAIYLNSPGRRINQVPPQVSNLPVSFFWNSVATTFNDQYLIIKEFAPSEMPQSHSVQTRGAVVYHSPLPVESGFSDYLPFNAGCYYAWQVYTPLRDGSNPYTPDARNASDKQRLASAWNVFQYVDDSQDELAAAELYSILSQWSNQAITDLLMQGYRPTGEVILDGRSYNGAEAMDIMNNLAGKEYQLRIRD